MPKRDRMRGATIAGTGSATPEHVLTKAFYLMQSFPGRYDRGRVWVELRPDGLNDGVSPVIIGGNDWAAAWATDEQGRPLAAVLPGGNRQRELAWRFGVNGTFMTEAGIPSFEQEPANEIWAHTPEEHIGTRDIILATRAIARTVAALAAIPLLVLTHGGQG